MAILSGMGEYLFVDGYDLSGDVGAASVIGSRSDVLDITAINQSAHARIHSLADGELTFNSFFNDAAGASHTILAAKGSGGQRIVMWLQGGAIGNIAAAMQARQVNFPYDRQADGSLIANTQCLADSYGLEFCQQLTAGKRSDTTATNGSSLDGGGATTSGWSAYLEVFSFTGTSCTVTIQDSANDSTFAGVTGGGFTAATGITKQKLVSASGATLRQYVRLATTGTFSECTFAVVLTRFPNAF